MREIVSANDGDYSWSSQKAGDEDDPDIPEGGWLVIACFHTLWSTKSLKLIPVLNDIVPIFQDRATFLSVRADTQELSPISKSFNVQEFPTIIVFRGGVELDRVEGDDRTVERVIRAINIHVKAEDKMAHMKRRHRIKLEKELGMEGSGGYDDVLDEPEERGQIEWTWDPENCAKDMNIQKDGMNVILKEEVSFADRVVWERSVGRNKWAPLKPEYQIKLEKAFKKGRLFNNGYYTFPNGNDEVWCENVEITTYIINGFKGYISGQHVSIRRDGDRLVVPGEEQYLSEEQRQKDKRAAEWRDKWEAQKRKMKEERIGRDVESIRGTTGYLKDTGIYYWELRWEHTPGREGSSDSVGICSDLTETFGPGQTPLVGGSNDSGASLALYADGSILHNGSILFTVKRPTAISAETEEVTTDGSKEAFGETKDCDKGFDPEQKLDSARKKGKKGETKKGKAHSVYDPKKESDQKTNNPTSTTGTPLVFGEGTIIRCELDTNLNGGTVRFFVDGLLLSAEVGDLYNLLGGSEIYPIISTCPLDPVDMRIGLICTHFISLLIFVFLCRK